MTTIKKRDLVVSISTASGLTQEQTLDVVQRLLDTVTDHVADGNEVVLRNFGAFQVKRTKPKVGRNPSKPGSEVKIPERTIVKFKPGKEMKDRVALLIRIRFQNEGNSLEVMNVTTREARFSQCRASPEDCRQYQRRQ
jgi:nucleoid DNA-binding protein